MFSQNSTFSLPPPLKPEQTIQLFRKKESGDIFAREQIIEHNSRLCIHIARKFLSTGHLLDDLFSVATIGLVKAVDTFKTDKDIKFATYASRCIENEILMMLRREKKHNLNISFDAALTTDIDGNELLLSDVLEDNKVGDFILPFISKDQTAEINEALYQLEAKHRDIIHDHFYEQKTQKQIAKERKISQSYVSRLSKKAIYLLKKNMDMNLKTHEQQNIKNLQRKEEDIMARKKARGNREEAYRLLRETRMTYKEIADVTGVPVGTVGAVANEHRPEHVRKELSRERQQKHYRDRAKEKKSSAETNPVEESEVIEVPRDFVVPNSTKEEPAKTESKGFNSKENEVPDDGPTLGSQMIQKGIDDFRADIEKEIREKIEKEKEMEETSSTQPTSKIKRSLTFRYHSSGDDIAIKEFMDEVEALVATLKDSNNQSVTFSIDVEAK